MISDKTQFVSINGFNSDYKTIKYGVYASGFSSRTLTSRNFYNDITIKN